VASYFRISPTTVLYGFLFCSLHTAPQRRQLPSNRHGVTSQNTWIINNNSNNNNNNKKKKKKKKNKKKKKTKNTFLIDIAVPNTHNLAKTINDKQNKYQELANEICAMWKQNTAQVIPLVISSTGVIPKSLSQSLKRLNLHPNTYIQMQKSVILGTCSIVRNFLNYK